MKKAISKLLTGVVAACALPLGAAGLDPPEAVGVCLKALLAQPEESRATLLSAQTLSADAMQVEIRAKLFAIEKELPPVDVMFLYRVIELTGDIGDMAERIGRRLELLLCH